MQHVVLFFIMGMVAVFLEFFIPGGVLGAIGICLMAVGVFFAYGEWGFTGAFASGAIGLVLGTGSFLAAMYIVPRTRLGRILIQEEATTGDKGYNAADVSLRDLVGKEGVTITPLRPSGIARIDEKRVDVVSADFMIERGTKVRVSQVEGNRVEVVEIRDET